MPPKRKENLRDREVAPKMTVHLKPHKKRTDQQLNKETEEFQQNVMNELHKSLNVVFNKYRYEADGLYFDVEYRETKKKINKTVSAFILDVFESHIDDLDDKYEFIFLLDSGGDKKSEKDKSRSRSASISRSASRSRSSSSSRSRSKSPSSRLYKLKAEKGRSVIFFSLLVESDKKVTQPTIKKIIERLTDIILERLQRKGYDFRAYEYDKDKSVLSLALDGPPGMATFHSIDSVANDLISIYNLNPVNGVKLARYEEYEFMSIKTKEENKLTDEDIDYINNKLNSLKLKAGIELDKIDFDDRSKFTLNFKKVPVEKKGKKSAAKPKVSSPKKGKKTSVGRGRKAKK